MEVVFIEQIDESTPDRLNDVYKDFAKKQILVEYDGKNSKQLARKYGYTERVIRDWLAEGESTG